ncbi:MAG: hypothetical protein WC254_01330 [Candidatus Woesearchaeota archaeon]|jgi:hypothetical protein
MAEINEMNSSCLYHPTFLKFMAAVHVVSSAATVGAACYYLSNYDVKSAIFASSVALLNSVAAVYYGYTHRVVNMSLQSSGNPSGLEQVLQGSEAPGE